MLLVIFGAGASYDSTYDRRLALFPVEEFPWRPPLANELFERPVFREKLREYRHNRALLTRFSPMPAGKTIEGIMDEVASEADRVPIRRSQLAALRFYLRDLIWVCGRTWLAQSNGTTNYYNVLDQLSTWRAETDEPVCLTTFNYDLLLEDALATYDRTLDKIDNYIINPDGDTNWYVIKPHGSVNWARLVNTPIDRQDVDTLIRSAERGLDISENYVIAGPYDATWSNGHMHFPAIALPVESYKEFELPPKHLGRLRQCLRDARHIVTIGWRATEKPFLQLMSQQLQPMPGRKTIIVDVDEGDTTEQNLRAERVDIGGNVTHYRLGFSNFVTQQHLAHMLLAR